MSRRAGLDGSRNAEHAIPADWMEHLNDELQWLHLRIHLQVLKQRKQWQSSPLEQLRGIVLSEEEIDELLAGQTELLLDDTSDSEALPIRTALKQLEEKVLERRRDLSLPLSKLSHTFKLSGFEERCLIICLAPELDRKYEKFYAYLHDDVTRKRPSIGLVMDLLCPSFDERIKARTRFAPHSPLLKYRLLEPIETSMEGSASFPSRELKIADRVVDFLLGINALDARLAPFGSIVVPQVSLERVTVSGELQEKTRSFIRNHQAKGSIHSQHLIFHFHGPDGSGKRSLAAAVSHDLGLTLIVADVARMQTEAAFEELIWILGREVSLQGATLCLEGVDSLLTEEPQSSTRLRSLLETIGVFSPVTFVCGSRPWRPQGLPAKQVFMDLEFPLPGVCERKSLWEKQIKRSPEFTDIDCGALADIFLFTPGQVEDAIVAARNASRWRSADRRPISYEELHAACRSLSNEKLGMLARKITPAYDKKDIVLPTDQMQQLLDLCSQARYRHIVYGEWGFDKRLSLGKGIAALFSGPPGTGKTMAAEVIANELKLDLYRIDLSQVVSKYIGETEKNLNRLFTEAQTSNGILLFDEADALFGKRSEVKDAHDRYANIEIGYLLQKMEEYQGIAILATNMRASMDEAFVRRLQVIIDFPFPDEEHRERIWRSMFPPQVPLGGDIDFDFLARRFKIAGGSIKNIAVASAFSAAEHGTPLAMKNILRATRRELQKMGRMVTKDELGEYFDLATG